MQSAIPAFRRHRILELGKTWGIALAIVIGPPAAALAQSPSNVVAESAAKAIGSQSSASELALFTALSDRLTVWKSDSGKRTYARHCRSGKGITCEQRLQAIAEILLKSALRHDVDPFLLAAIALRESGLNPFAEGGIGERGIVQLHPRGVGRGVQFVRNERYRNACAKRADACQGEVVDAGAKLIASAIRRCGTVKSGLGAYNSGHCQETSYSDKVLRERGKLLRLAKGKSKLHSKKARFAGRLRAERAVARKKRAVRKRVARQSPRSTARP